MAERKKDVREKPPEKPAARAAAKPRVLTREELESLRARLAKKFH
jgi:hypothetical protein